MRRLQTESGPFPLDNAGAKLNCRSMSWGWRGGRGARLAGVVAAVLPIACSARPLDPGSGSVTTQPTEWSDGLVVAGSGRPCAATSDGNRLAYVTNPNTDTVGLLSVRGAASATTIETGRMVKCETVQYAPQGEALAWQAGPSDERGGGFWGSQRDLPYTVSLATGPGGGGITEIAFSPDGRWIAMLLATQAAPFAWRSVLRLGAADGLSDLLDVPISLNYGDIFYAPDGALLLSAIDGDSYHIVGTMRLYRIDPATAAVQPLAAVAGTIDDLFHFYDNSGSLRRLPRVVGGKLVYAPLTNDVWRGTLVENTPRGEDVQPLLDDVSAFSGGFGPDGKHVLANVEHDGAPDSCCAVWDVDLETRLAAPVPGVPSDAGVIPIGDGHHLLLTSFEDKSWRLWDRDAAQSVLDVGLWRKLLWQSDDGRWLLGLEGASSGPFALSLVDVDRRVVRTLGEGVNGRSVQVLDGHRVLFVRGLSSPGADATGGTLVIAPIDGGEETVLATSVAPQLVVTTARRVFYAVDGTELGDGIYSLTLPP
jgi:WD40 repeat protein